jgi:hypothetical protein
MKTMTKLALAAALLLPLPLHAVITFERTYGGAGNDWGYSAVQTSGGGYAITGWTGSYGAGGGDAYLVRTDSLGDTLWTQTFGGSGYEEGRSVQQTLDGGFIIAGSTTSSGAGSDDVYVIKTNASGSPQWTRTVGGTSHDWGNSVQQTTDSGYIVVGSTESFGSGRQDVYLVKTDVNGATSWSRTFGGDSGDYGCSVQQTFDGGYIVAGYTYSFGAGGADFYVIRTNAHGDTSWTKTYGGASLDYGYSIQQTTDSGYIITGYAASYGAGNGDVYLIKIDPDGDTLWTKTFGSAGYDCGLSVRQTADGGYVIAGYTQSVDVYLVKTNAGGDLQWSNIHGDTSYYYWTYSVRQTTDGGYVSAGFANPQGTSEYDLYLIKTDSLGNVGVAEPKGPQAPSLKLQAEPNPCRGQTAISLQLTANSPNRLDVYDAAGQMVLSQPFRTSSFALSTSRLSAGTYFVRSGSARLRLVRMN